MREPLKLAEAAIMAALHAHYAISVATLAFLPLGDDSGSAAYRVQTADGTTYFLKVRTGAGFSLPSLVVPRYFRDRGVPHLVAPLPTIAGGLWGGANDFALSLYPFIDGRMGADGGLSEQHWRALGATLKQVHGDSLPSTDVSRIHE
jgi:spectinomycin phosphotransferase